MAALGQNNEQFSRNGRKNQKQRVNTQINNAHFKLSKTFLHLPACWPAKFLHKMTICEGVELMTWFEKVSYSGAVLYFDM